jgi:hypothetical protein
MADIIDLGAERARRDDPDPEFLATDQWGRTMYTFALSYQLGEKTFGVNVLAYDFDDAEARVGAMRASLQLDGKVISERPD